MYQAGSLPNVTDGTLVPRIAMMDCQSLLLCHLFPDSTRKQMLYEHLKGPNRAERVLTLAFRDPLLRHVKALGDQQNVVTPMEASTEFFWPIWLRVKDYSDREAAVAYVGDYYDTPQ